MCERVIQNFQCAGWKGHLAKRGVDRTRHQLLGCSAQKRNTFGITVKKLLMHHDYQMFLQNVVNNV